MTILSDFFVGLFCLVILLLIVVAIVITVRRTEMIPKGELCTYCVTCITICCKFALLYLHAVRYNVGKYILKIKRSTRRGLER